MTKRLLFILPLALALAACGSSAPEAPAASQANAPAASTTPTATPATTPAQSASAATPAPADSVAASATAPVTPAPQDNQMDAAAKAARTAAAKAFVDNGQWVEGKNYFLISPQQPKVTNTDKIEVVEVFSWGCPACNAAHPSVDKLAAELPSYATMAYLPAGFRPDENWVLYQKAFYAAKALGLIDQSYDAMFDATWKSGETATYNLATGRPKPQSEWPTIDDVAKFYTRYGVPAKQFKAVAESFAIGTKVKRADKLVRDYRVQATPTLVIDGKYRYTFQSAGSYEKAIALTKWLVAKEAAGK